ncbi:MAG: hypothetical protein AAF791_09760, partial [Bacteroidota bacterium]
KDLGHRATVIATIQPPDVFPAQAGIHAQPGGSMETAARTAAPSDQQPDDRTDCPTTAWIPAFAGMTRESGCRSARDMERAT